MPTGRAAPGLPMPGGLCSGVEVLHSSWVLVHWPAAPAAGHQGSQRCLRLISSLMGGVHRTPAWAPCNLPQMGGSNQVQPAAGAQEQVACVTALAQVILS